MGRWMERAAALELAGSGQADPVLTAEPIGTNGTIGTGLLPPAIFNGLTRLRTMPPPRLLMTPANWAGVVADAECLLMDGWVRQALRLRWEPLELFGVGNDYDGLAVWLNGRRLLLMAEWGAISRDGPTTYYFNRRAPSGAVMLWDWAR